MKNLDDYDRLVGMLYEVSLESGRWEESLGELMRQIDGTGFHFLGWDTTFNGVPFAACSESWRDFVAGYHNEYGKMDPHLQAGLTNPVGHWLVSHHLFDERFVISIPPDMTLLDGSFSFFFNGEPATLNLPRGQ